MRNTLTRFFFMRRLHHILNSATPSTVELTSGSYAPPSFTTSPKYYVTERWRCAIMN